MTTPLEVLNKYFGHNSFRAGQEAIINAIIDGKNVVAILPTGAGKSICYQIPAILSSTFAIVISPLIALMKDQVDSINSIQRIAGVINSTLDYYETEKEFRKIESGETKLLYVSPERLENVKFAERIKNLNPEYIFVDEAHCISEWGHNFRPSYKRINEFVKFTGIKNISAFTATATQHVRKDIIEQLALENPKIFVQGFERDNLFINVVNCLNKKEKCFELLQKHPTPAIIYTATRKDAEEIADYLKVKKISCECYHAGLPSEKRRMIQDDFLSERIPLIIATNAFGMGIDKKNIRLIIHFSIPGTLENYYQEIGRAGRDGESSFVYLFYESKDRWVQDFFIRNSYPTKTQIRLVYDTVCDYGQVALNGKSDRPIEFDKKFMTILSAREISKAMLASSLNLLCDASYFKRNSEFSRKYQIKITIDKENLREYVKKISNQNIKSIFVVLVRDFSNYIFSSKTALDLQRITQSSGLPEEEVIASLKFLAETGIIDLEQPTDNASVLLSMPRITSNLLEFDYDKIDIQMQNAYTKLNSMVAFAHTKDCRFKYILDYFGDVKKDYSCEKCDNCRQIHEEHLTGAEFIKEKILDSIVEIDDDIEKTLLLQLLSGSEDPNITKNYCCSGILKNYSKREIDIQINEMIYSGALNNKNGILSIATAPEIKLNSGNFLVEDYDKNLELFNELRKLRKEISLKFGQSPKLICEDDLLREIAKKKPKTASQLLQIEGFNQRKFNKLGEEIIELVNHYFKKEETELISAELPDELKETFNLLNKKYLLIDIAKLRKLPESVISMQVETIILFRRETEISHLFKPDELEQIVKVIQTGETNLKNIKEQVDESIPYSKIRIALAKFGNNSTKIYS